MSIGWQIVGIVLGVPMATVAITVMAVVIARPKKSTN